MPEIGHTFTLMDKAGLKPNLGSYAAAFEAFGRIEGNTINIKRYKSFFPFVVVVFSMVVLTGLIKLVYSKVLSQPSDITDISLQCTKFPCTTDGTSWAFRHH